MFKILFMVWIYFFLGGGKTVVLILTYECCINPLLGQILFILDLYSYVYYLCNICINLDTSIPLINN